MMFSRSILTLSLVSICLGLLNGQMSVLEERLRGLERVEDIMEVVDEYYAEIESGQRQLTDEPKYKHWARWGWYMSGRTDSDGKLVDVQANLRKAMRAYQPQTRSSAGNWTFIGPGSLSGGSNLGIGRVDRIAFHPTNANIIYIGTSSGGVFKSSNGGTSWSAITDRLPSTGISGIVVNYANPNQVFILTGDGDASGGGFILAAGYQRSSAGVFVTYDAGINWYPTAPLPITGTYSGYALTQDPNNPGIMLAATSEGLFRTNNYGGSWTEVLDGRTYEVKFRPGNSSYVYATQLGEFWRSTDGGMTWTEITDFDVPLSNGSRNRLAINVTPGQSNRVYLLAGEGSGSTFDGMYVSYDYGASFNQQSNTPNIVMQACDGSGGANQSLYDLAIAVDPSNNANVIAAGITTWASGTTGSTWTNVSSGRCTADSESNGYVHADVHDIEFNPLNNSVYVCSDGGLIRSDDMGVNWINLSDGIAASQIYHMAGTPNDLDNVMIGLQDNGTRRRNANTSVWDVVLNADGFDCVYRTAHSDRGYLVWNASVERFTGNGSTLTSVTPAAVSGFFPHVQVHNTDDQFVLVGSTDIHRSTNFGTTWTNEGASGNWDIERCPSNSDRFYAAGGASSFATSGTMYRSDDEGLTWITISGNTGFPSVSQRITDIEVNPAGSNNVWIVLGGFSDGQKVFTSYDAGNSWANVSGSLPNVPINAIQVDAGSNAYIGTDFGVFYRPAGGDWLPFWNRLPIVPVTDLELYTSDNLLRASTFGRGVWQSDLYSSCNTFYSLTSNINGNRYYEASNYIHASGIIYGGANTTVTMKAGDHVEFTQGFRVGAGNKFRAYLSPCGVVD